MKTFTGYKGCVLKPNDISHQEMIVITFYCTRNSPTPSEQKKKKKRANNGKPQKNPKPPTTLIVSLRYVYL